MNFLDILNLKEGSAAKLSLILTYRFPSDTASYPRRTDSFEPHVLRSVNYKISDIFSSWSCNIIKLLFGTQHSAFGTLTRQQADGSRNRVSLPAQLLW